VIGLTCMPTKPEPLNLGVPVVNFPRANAILARAQALLWVRDWSRAVYQCVSESACNASVNSSCDHPPLGQPPGIGKFSFFLCKCPGVGPKKRNNAPPLGRKNKQMPHPRADKLVNFKECTKLITCVLTICIYTSVNCSFGDLKTNKQGKLSCSFQMKTSTKGCDTLAFIAESFSL
jgi:hypothetical protein